jgi:hypothetical protein
VERPADPEAAQAETHHPGASRRAFLTEHNMILSRGQKVILATDAANKAGRWFLHKYRYAAVEKGVQAAARNMRKQGVPISIALFVLAGRLP